MRFPYTTPFRSRRTAAKKEPARLRALTLLPRALARFVGQRPSVGRRLSDRRHGDDFPVLLRRHDRSAKVPGQRRSEEHTSELQSLMRISYAVFCLKKKKQTLHNQYK